MVLSLLGLAALTVWEWNAWTHDRGSIIGLAYIPFFLGLITWRCAFDYKFLIDEKTIRVTTQGMGFSRSWEVPVGDVQSIVPKYKHRFMRERGVWTHFHKYSSLDDNPRRILLLQKKGDKRPKALLFKADERLFEEVVRMLTTTNPKIKLFTLKEVM